MQTEIATEPESDLHRAIEAYADDHDLPMADAYVDLLEDGLAANVADQPTAAEDDHDAVGDSDEAPESPEPSEPSESAE